MGPSMQLTPGACLKYLAATLARATQLNASGMLAPSSWGWPVDTNSVFRARMRSCGVRPCTHSSNGTPACCCNVYVCVEVCIGSRAKTYLPSSNDPSCGLCTFLAEYQEALCIFHLFSRPFNCAARQEMVCEMGICERFKIVKLQTVVCPTSRV